LKINLLATAQSGKGLSGGSGKFRTLMRRTPTMMEPCKLKQLFQVVMWEKQFGEELLVMDAMNMLENLLATIPSNMLHRDSTWSSSIN
jgi:hypothetical protein